MRRTPVARAALGATLVLVACLPARARQDHEQAPAASYAVVGRVRLPGDGTWDHVTVAGDARRLYVAHEKHVDVLDLDADTIVGVLARTPDVHGVALAPDLDRGYTADGGDSALTVFDPATLAVRGRVRLRADAPDGIAYDSVTRRVFALHGASPGLTVVDAGPDTVRATLALGGAPDGAAPDGRGRVYVTLKDRSELLALDSRRLTVERRWPVAPCAGPDAMALEAAGAHVLLGCDNRVAVVVDVRDGRVMSAFPIGEGVDGVAVDGAGAVLVACGDGTLTVARPDRAGAYRVTAVVPTGRGARTIAVDPRRGRLYLPTATFATRAADDRTGRRAPVVPGSFILLIVGRAQSPGIPRAPTR